MDDGVITQLTLQKLLDMVSCHVAMLTMAAGVNPKPTKLGNCFLEIDSHGSK
jgi:hypothetical protein